MKNFIFTFVVWLCFVSMLKSQDIIVMRNGDEIKAKVMEITLDEIKYKMFNNPDGPIIIILKKDVFMIKFHNGTKQVFEEQQQSRPEQQQQEDVQNDARAMYNNGCNDARFSYNGNGPMWGTIGASIGCLVPAGLITAIAVSSTHPSVNNLNMNYSMMKNKDYVNGYRDTAFKIKKKKAWQGFAIVGCIEIAFFFLLRGAVLSQ